MKLSKRQKAIVIGSLLGDGCLERNGRNVRLRIEHSDSQKEYLLWKCKKLQRLITERSPMKINAFHKVYKRRYISWRAYTMTNINLNELFYLFYKENKKIIPYSIIKDLTDPLSLAVWFMDDGYKRNDCNAFRISTDSFTYHENELLVKVLKQNFGLNCNIHKKGNYWNIYIPKKSAYEFKDLISLYIIPTLRYKIALAP